MSSENEQFPDSQRLGCGSPPASKPRRLRWHAGKSIEQVAFEAGLSQGTVSRAERYPTTMSQRTRCKIAHVLGVTEADLIDGDDANLRGVADEMGIEKAD